MTLTGHIMPAFLQCGKIIRRSPFYAGVWPFNLAARKREWVPTQNRNLLTHPAESLGRGRGGQPLTPTTAKAGECNLSALTGVGEERGKARGLPTSIRPIHWPILS